MSYDEMIYIVNTTSRVTYQGGNTFDFKICHLIKCLNSKLAYKMLIYQGPILEIIYVFIIQIYENMYCSCMRYTHLIRSEFCTCHASWAKLWPDRVIKIPITTILFKQDLDYEITRNYEIGLSPRWNMSSHGILFSCISQPERTIPGSFFTIFGKLSRWVSMVSHFYGWKHHSSSYIIHCDRN